ncbi:hypothetical protein [Acutalibacter sp. 1XD8-33]|uniref:hypothetical protein n=1 Tax=Acutalibacter sp. 1XD8-33 TaxID=2320081 RepID=UPI0011C35850|nr:hypothetical protein [Acutalibacter sp. 1XD8-33]
MCTRLSLCVLPVSGLVKPSAVRPLMCLACCVCYAMTHGLGLWLVPVCKCAVPHVSWAMLAPCYGEYTE